MHHSTVITLQHKYDCFSTDQLPQQCEKCRGWIWSKSTAVFQLQCTAISKKGILHLYYIHVCPASVYVLIMMKTNPSLKNTTGKLYDVILTLVITRSLLTNLNTFLFLGLGCWFLTDCPRFSRYLNKEFSSVCVCVCVHMHLISLEIPQGTVDPRHLSWASEALNLYGHFPLSTAATAIICQERCTKLFGSP